MKDFQFSVSDPTASPPTEATHEGKVILTPIMPAESISEAMSKLTDWCNGANEYNRTFRIYKPVRK